MLPCAERAKAHDIPLDSIASYINCFKCAAFPTLPSFSLQRMHGLCRCRVVV